MAYSGVTGYLDSFNRAGVVVEDIAGDFSEGLIAGLLRRVG
jgi:hypothetical protein